MSGAWLFRKVAVLDGFLSAHAVHVVYGFCNFPLPNTLLEPGSDLPRWMPVPGVLMKKLELLRSVKPTATRRNGNPSRMGMGRKEGGQKYTHTRNQTTVTRANFANGVDEFPPPVL